MKTIPFLLLFAFSITLSAQQLVSGSVNKLRGQRQMSFTIDYSKARIDGMTESMFRVQRTLEEEHADGWEDRWEGKTLPKLRSCFCNGENECTYLKMGNYKNTKYTATYVVEELRTNGTNWGKVIIRESATGNEIAVISVKGSCSSKNGSWEYKMFDGMRDSGKKLGQYFRRKL